MKRNCETCRHWVLATEKDWGDCKLTETYRDNPDHGKSLAVAWSYGSDEAGLLTHATFGCVQWEAKT